MLYTFSFNSMIRGYHKYIMIWNNPIAGEGFTCHREAGNSHDSYAVAVKILNSHFVIMCVTCDTMGILQ